MLVRIKINCLWYENCRGIYETQFASLVLLVQSSSNTSNNSKPLYFFLLPSLPPSIVPQVSLYLPNYFFQLFSAYLHSVSFTPSHPVSIFLLSTHLSPSYSLSILLSSHIPLLSPPTSPILSNVLLGRLEHRVVVTKRTEGQGQAGHLHTHVHILYRGQRGTLKMFGSCSVMQAIHVLQDHSTCYNVCVCEHELAHSSGINGT